MNEIDRRVRYFVLRILKLNALRRCIGLPRLGGRTPVLSKGMFVVVFVHGKDRMGCDIVCD